MSNAIDISALMVERLYKPDVPYRIVERTVTAMRTYDCDPRLCIRELVAAAVAMGRVEDLREFTVACLKAAVPVCSSKEDEHNGR
uniref:NAD-dependent formate dehydrogenase n=1 Tax=Aureimonas frigidaquae TaxID=424757 RepID=A0A0N7KY50_9HYPH|nr:NAD-dependent formate dehydrogenase [Aureimonas frigidaquae]